MTPKEGETKLRIVQSKPDGHAAESEAVEVEGEPESRDAKLTAAIRGLLDALDRCAGDPPDCPHCGPARAAALELLSGVNGLAQAGEQREQERVSLLGRVGADPTFRTTPKGTLVGRFPLAVHGEGNSTTWYPVLAFNQRAERLKESVVKGEAVRVVGYVHERETKTRDGEPRTVREVYAVSVAPPSTR